MTDALPFAEPRLLIDGQLVEATGGGAFDNINPATEEVLGQTADGTAEDMRRAVAAARRAFDTTPWATDAKLRRRCLEQLQTALEKHKEDFRQAVVAEAGSPVLMTYAIQTDLPIADLAFWAQLADSYEYERWVGEREVLGGRHRRLVRREAAGVVAAITPWNFPLFLNLAKLGPALAAGCTLVLKPAPDTPWSATLLGRTIVEQTDIPPGVVNIVASADHLVGEVLTTDPRMDMVTFTGSTATGRRIMAKAAGTVKKVFLELGGKSAHIVLDDADVAGTCSTLGFLCAHAGQGCALVTRWLLPRSRYAEGVAAATESMQSMAAGDPTDPATLCGPVINAKQRERILGYIEAGTREGARLLVGGGTPSDKPRGFYVEPTLFADVDENSTIAQEEIFGPVFVLIPYEDDDDAVRIANNSSYGLSGAVTSASEERALAIARRIRTGTVAVNGGVWLGPDVPFGGYRQSGLGRENGIEGFEEYLEVKTVALPAAGSRPASLTGD
jgi:aldehyde dehydrogenase (NAD+)